MEEYLFKVDVPMGIFEIPTEEKNSYGKILLYFGREYNFHRKYEKNYIPKFQMFYNLSACSNEYWSTIQNFSFLPMGF